MGTSSEFKREFVKKWLKGLQTYSSLDKKMSLMERKKAIKLSADVAMASTRIHTSTTLTSSSANWSCALITKAKMDNVALIENILSPDDHNELEKKVRECKSSQLAMCKKRFKSKKILKKSNGISKRARQLAPKASVLAKRLVKKRTQVLKRLVPGGESMDEVCLIKETLDYIISLRAQVDVMRCLANATDNQVLNSTKKLIDHIVN